MEAATLAWEPLGWECAFVSEIDKAPCDLLEQRINAPNLGDMTKFEEWPDYAIDLLVGGTPCQSFSVAGLRKGLADPRGSLMLTYGAIAKRYRPRWLVWENVPGVLSDDGGRSFGTFLGMLGELGYGFAYRVLDAQYFGLAQRRARVFVVGYLGDWRPPAAVLFESESLRGDPAPRREAGQRPAPTIAARTRGGGGLGTDFDFDCDGGLIAHTLKADGFDASEDGTGRGTPLVPVVYSIMPQNSGKDYKAREVQVAQPIMAGGPVGGNQGGDYICQPVAFSCKDHGADAGDLAPTMRAMGHDGSHANAGGQLAVAIQAGALRENPSSGPDGVGVQEGLAYTIEARAEVQAVQHDWAVRRLTPKECERLQGAPDDWTNITRKGRPIADGPRYKMLGNSMAVPVMRWIGDRIELVDAHIPKTNNTLPGGVLADSDNQGTNNESRHHGLPDGRSYRRVPAASDG